VAALATAFSLPLPKSPGEAATGTFEPRRTPSSGTPAHLDPRISPGATSVHPPPHAEPPRWEEDVVIPRAREIHGLTPASDPALAETEIPALHDIAAATRLPRSLEGLEPVKPRPPLLADTPFPVSVLELPVRAVSPSGVVVVETPLPIAARA
jgi:hypothetical protein